MVTVGLLGFVVIAILAVVVFGLAQMWTLEIAFIRLSWIPLVALIIEGLSARFLTATLGYFAVAIPVMTCIASLVLAFIGATLLSSARERGESSSTLVAGTVVASIPAALLVVYILYAFLEHALLTVV